MKATLISSTRLIALVGCAAMVVSAHAGGDAPAPHPVAKAKASSHWTRAAAGKHNGSGIRVSYIVPAGMQPGQSARVQLQFSGVTADDAKVEWRGPAGSSISSAQLGAATTMALPAGQVTTISLDVTAAADGMAYLDVFTSQGGRGSAQSLPLKVGSGKVALKREGTMQTAPSGEKVLSLPSTPK